MKISSAGSVVASIAPLAVSLCGEPAQTQEKHHRTFIFRINISQHHQSASNFDGEIRRSLTCAHGSSCSTLRRVPKVLHSVSGWF